VIENLFSDDKVRLDILKRRAVGMRWAGMPEGTIPLTSADPDFVPAKEINEAMIEFIKGGYFPYAPVAIDGLREIIAQRMEERKGITTSPEFITPIDSAASAMQGIALSVLQPGDEAIIFDPVDLLFGIAVRYAKAKVIHYPGNYDYKKSRWDFSDLESYITHKTKMICLCNPHNPMGVMYTKDELMFIAQLAGKYNLWIMNDEIWSDIVYSEKPFISINSLGPELNKRTISCYGYSKGFGVPGLRAGYIYTMNKDSFEVVTKAATNIISGVDYVTQIAMKTAFEKCFYWVDAFREHLQGNRDYIYKRFQKMPLIKATKQEATFVTFPDISATGMSCQEFRDFLFEEHKVALVPGTKKWFGPRGEGHVRLVYSTSHAILEESLNRIEAGLIQLANR